VHPAARSRETARRPRRTKMRSCLMTAPVSLRVLNVSGHGDRSPVPTLRTKTRIVLFARAVMTWRPTETAKHARFLYQQGRAPDER
jgi:hypothetical protein